MLKLIIFKELREIILSTKFAATFGVGSILIILAFYTGIKNYQASVQEYNASNAAELSQFETAKNWSEAPRHTVFLPPEPLASLVLGISNDIGKSGVIYDRGYQAFRDSRYSVNPVFAVFRFLDLEFIFLIVLSLFAILFAFDAINGEKERGTLRLSFASSVPRATFIIGKITGSFAALGLPLLVPVLIGLLLLPVMGVPLSGDEWIRLVILIVCGMLYLGVFLTLSVFISCITKRSSSSFLFLLLIWVCSVLIIPRASTLLAGNMIEVPSTSKIYYQRLQMMNQQSREYLTKLNEIYEGFYKELAQSGDTSPEAIDQTQKKISKTLENIQADMDKNISVYVNRLNEERYNKQVQQERLALGIARLSPSAVLTLASNELCGTSLELRNNFRERLAIYSGDYYDFIEKKQKQNSGDMQTSSPVNPAEIPEFIYQPNEPAVIMQRVFPDIAILFIFNLVFFLAAFIAFLRYDLR
jgi:ABC-type transport system involved in multi-copper enzyme maturation permease subunit